MKKLLSLLAVSAALTQSALAGDLSGLGGLSQSEFRTLSEDFGAAFSYKPIAPSEAQGLTGFDLGVELTGTDMSRSAGALTKAGASESTMNLLLVPKLHLHKGLTGRMDAGAFIGSVPAINANLYGAELRYALLQGGVATPAIGVRGAFTQLSGPSQLTFNTRSLDISISKGFVLFTPYVGVGQVWVNSSPNAGSLAGENFNQGKVFAGASMGLGLFKLTFEGDRTGDTTSWGVKLGLRW